MLFPGKVFANPVEAISLGISMMLGTMGLPHILMRFFTVPDARAARQSVFVSTGLMAFFFFLVFALGMGAAALVGKEAITAVDKGGNVALPLLAGTVGGQPFLGFISAVAFATILAVVAGLTLSGAGALSHDLWTNVVRKGKASEDEQLKVARAATIGLSLVAIGLGLLFKGYNIAALVGLVFGLAASANFPALLMSIYWKRFTTPAAVASIMTGVIGSIGLIVLSPTVQVDLLGNAQAYFPLRNIGIVTIPLAFAVGIGVALLTHEKEAEEGFVRQRELRLAEAAG
jgi:cation/acetate symporter